MINDHRFKTCFRICHLMNLTKTFQIYIYLANLESIETNFIS